MPGSGTDPILCTALYIYSHRYLQVRGKPTAIEGLPGEGANRALPQQV